jgi:DNA-binding LacI/PurR family transcriptional regulator
MRVKIKDVAEAAEVSIATVSYVLNNSAPVSEETRRRVLDAVDRLGYRPNITARNLKASETRIIGYAWHKIPAGQLNSVLDRFIYQMALAAESHGYHVLTFTQSARTPAAAYEELIQTGRVDGFILSGTVQNDERIKMLLDRNFPFVSFGRSNPGWAFPSVDVDGRAGVRLAMDHLIAQGHHRIAWLGWPSGSLAGEQRYQGYLDSLQAAKIEPRKEWHFRSSHSLDEAREVILKAFSRPSMERPTALVCVSDLVAMGAMEAFEKLGIRPGVDIAMTGFDDDPVSSFVRPALTSLRQPIDEIAAKVIEMLVTLLTQPDQLTRTQLLLIPTLIARDSSQFTP